MEEQAGRRGRRGAGLVIGMATCTGPVELARRGIPNPLEHLNIGLPTRV